MTLFTKWKKKVGSWLGIGSSLGLGFELGSGLEGFFWVVGGSVVIAPLSKCDGSS